MMTTPLLELLFAQLWQVTIVSVVAGWLSRTILAKHPGWSYSLWLVVMVKCLTPPLLASQCGVFSWFFHRLMTVSSQAAVTVAGGAVSADQIAVGMLCFWAAGIALKLGAMAVAWLRVQRSFITVEGESIRSLEARVSKLAKRLGIRRPVRLVVSAAPIGPAAVGVWRPAVVMPAGLLETRELDDIEPMLAHELLHISRGDTWAAILETVARTVWWFHPQVQRAARSMSQVCELCCDQDVLANFNYSPRRYAECLLRVLESRCQLQALPGRPGIRGEQVTRNRIRRIMSWSGEKRPARLRCLVVMLAVLVVLPGKSM